MRGSVTGRIAWERQTHLFFISSLCNKPFVLTRNSLLLLSIHHIVSGDAEVESVRISIKYSLSINCSSLKYIYFYCYLSCIVWNNIVEILSRNERERRDQDENQEAAVWAEYEPAPRVQHPFGKNGEKT